jgi:hypothetical protein
LVAQVSRAAGFRVTDLGAGGCFVPKYKSTQALYFVRDRLAPSEPCRTGLGLW